MVPARRSDVAGDEKMEREAGVQGVVLGNGALQAAVPAAATRIEPADAVTTRLTHRIS